MIQMKSFPSRRLLWQIPFLLFLIAGTLYIARQQRTEPYQHHSGTIFGTTYHIRYQSSDNLHADIRRALNEVDASLSTFNPHSVISRINRNETTEVDDRFAEVFRLAERISGETHGAFDITVAPLVNAWGFGFKNGTMPTKPTIDSLLPTVGYEKVQLQGRCLRKQNPHTMLDCSAIAKGYGSDVVARLLKKHGVRNLMVEIGGEIVVAGLNEQQQPWRVGVAKPTDDSLSIQQELQTVLRLTNCAMATSGNYRKFYYRNGRKYAHTIDPRTGCPVQHNILSATVVAPNCAMADAYATAFMVMGLQGARQVLKAHPELSAYLIYSDAKGRNTIWVSPTLAQRIQK